VASKAVRAVVTELLSGSELYREVVLRRISQARESVWISTANVKAMFVEQEGRFRPVLALFGELEARGVELRLLHAELPSRPFRKAFDARSRLVSGGLALKICPRVHFKAVLVDGAWLYLGSANLTGSGLGAKGPHKRNFELGFVTEDFALIDQVSALYDSIWSGRECAHCKLRDVCPDPIGGAKPRRSGIRLGHSRRLETGARRHP
jgi:phosphatidylserine/phosphatidylglycerophosphate/cardiolipin synthase-like enzyme